MSYNNYESLALCFHKREKQNRKREKKVKELVTKMDMNKSPSLKNPYAHLKLKTCSSPLSVAYEGRRAMELKARLAIDIIFDIA